MVGKLRSEGIYVSLKSELLGLDDENMVEGGIVFCFNCVGRSVGTADGYIEGLLEVGKLRSEGIYVSLKSELLGLDDDDMVEGGIVFCLNCVGRSVGTADGYIEGWLVGRLCGEDSWTTDFKECAGEGTWVGSMYA